MEAYAMALAQCPSLALHFHWFHLWPSVLSSCYMTEGLTQYYR